MINKLFATCKEGQTKPCKKHLQCNLIGAGISMVCLIHCLLTPIVIGYLSVAHHTYHLLDYLFLGLALIFIIMVTFNTKNFWIKTGLWVGLTLLVSGLVIQHSAHQTPWLVYGGSILLLVSHSFNLFSSNLRLSCNQK